MFMPRRVEPVDPIELADMFTLEESDRILALRQQFHSYPDQFKLEINYQRLEFARWLVAHGCLDEWQEGRDDLGARR
jgi:hypothetical protein